MFPRWFRHRHEVMFKVNPDQNHYFWLQYVAMIYQYYPHYIRLGIVYFLMIIPTGSYSNIHVKFKTNIIGILPLLMTNNQWLFLLIMITDWTSDIQWWSTLSLNHHLTKRHTCVYIYITSVYWLLLSPLYPIGPLVIFINLYIKTGGSDSPYWCDYESQLSNHYFWEIPNQ